MIAVPGGRAARVPVLAIAGLGIVLASLGHAQPVLVSRAPDGTPGDRDSTSPALSRDGRFVAFASDATNLVAADTNSATDIFVHDRATGETTRVSVATNGAEANGASRSPSISGDGRYVAFESDATNLVPDEYCFNAPGPGDTNGVTDIFVHDTQARRTSRVSMGAGTICAPTCVTFCRQIHAPSWAPAMSEDGTQVVFTSATKAFGSTDGQTARDCAAPDFFDAAPCGGVFVTRRTAAHEGTSPYEVSIGADGQPANGWTGRASISADGRYVAFDSSATNLVTDPGLSCRNSGTQGGVFLVDSAARTITHVGCSSSGVSLSPNGRWLGYGGVVHDLVTGDIRAPLPFLDSRTGLVGPGSITVSDAERVVTFLISHRYGFVGTVLWDPIADWQTSISQGFKSVCNSISGDGSTLGCMTQTLSPGTPTFQILVEPVDRDGDSLPDSWETRFGFNPASAGDEMLDPDGDGRSNLTEWREGSHPRGTTQAYLAEGATGFFQTVIRFVNGSSDASLVRVRLMSTTGEVRSQDLGVSASSVETVDVGAKARLEPGAFSVLVEADRPIHVEREMLWDASDEGRQGGSPGPVPPRQGAHAERGVASPSTTWFFAEGATHSGFDLFYLVQNPGETAATVDATFLRPTPHGPLSRRYVVSPHSRLTIWVNQEGPELATTDVATTFVSDRPIVVERAMYLAREGRPFVAGHAAAGVVQPELRWYLAEGATTWPFDLFLLVANPGEVAAHVRVTYLQPDGVTLSKEYIVEGRSRFNIWVDHEQLPAGSGQRPLADTAIGMVVESLNDVPVVVERSMWWPAGEWYEGHAAAALSELGTSWLLAGGRGPYVSDSPEVATYVLVLNPGRNAGRLQLTWLNFGSTQEVTLPLPAFSRITIPAHEIFGLRGHSSTFGVLVTAFPDGSAPLGAETPFIAVERATYWTTGSRFWEAGTVASATRLR